MGGWRRRCGGILSVMAMTVSGPAAAETTTFTYDALGRLTASSTSGGTNSGVNTAICMDAAGNRTAYATATSGTASCPSAPPPSNNPPVANTDVLSAAKCETRQVNVTANDTDPDGDYPLQVTGTDQPWANPVSASTIELFTPAANGSYQVHYTVQDSRGATATGTLNVTITGSQQCA